jgi:hypothetical protein
MTQDPNDPFRIDPSQGYLLLLGLLLAVVMLTFTCGELMRG